MKTRKNSLSRNSLSFVLIIFVTSCSNPEKAFEKAEKTNTIEAYESFINKYDDSLLVDQAKLNMISLEYLSAEETDTEEAFLQFVEKYPSDQYTEQAKQEASKIAFERAANANDIEIYNEFLAKYPESVLRDTVRDIVEKIEWSGIEKKYDFTSLYEYLKEYPEGNYTESAYEEIAVIHKKKNRNINPVVQSMGTFVDGYQKYISVLRVMYDGYMGEYAVSVQYQLTPSSGHLINSPGFKRIKANGDVEVEGKISFTKNSKTTTISLTDIAIPQNGEIFASFLVSEDAGFYESHAARYKLVDSINRLADSPSVSLFLINPDFTLLFYP